MFSKFWANVWILMSSSDDQSHHDSDRVVLKESRPEHSYHRRLLILSLMVLLLIHLWAPPGATGFSQGSFKRRISGSNGGKSLAEWDDIFQQRSDEDWRVLWHNEKHRRCQHQLLSHMELVCEKDIYKLARKKRRKRDLAGGEFGSDDSANSDQQEDIDGAMTDSESEPRFIASVSVPNVTRPLMPEFPKHPLFSTFKEANLFGRRQLSKTRKRQMSSGHSIHDFMPIGTKRSSRLERSKRGISDECCSGPDGCSWEEYAEYCPANVRVRIAN